MHAYGLTVPLNDVFNELSGSTNRLWHPATLSHSVAPAPDRTSFVMTEHDACLRAAGYATIVVKRQPLAVEVLAPTGPSEEALEHPLLAFVAAAAARWAHRSAFHGAAVVLNDRAWILLAGPSGGKSTLVSELNARGHIVLAEDLSVTDAGVVLAGPRSCDLREDSARALGRGQRLDAYVGRERWRETLGPAPYEKPLGGFAVLNWGQKSSVRRAHSARKLQLLYAHEALSAGPSDPTSFLELLDLPMLELERPRDWDALDNTVRLLEDSTRT
jgi:hypothetical protein